MARARSGTTPDNAAQVYIYLKDAAADPDRWGNLLKDGLKTRANEASSSLMAIPVLFYCPLSHKPSPNALAGIGNIQQQPKDQNYLCAQRAPDIMEFNAWINSWLSGAGWARILTALRQSRHTERAQLKSIKIEPEVHSRLVEAAASMGVDGVSLNDAIDKLITFAKDHPETFNR